MAGEINEEYQLFISLKDSSKYISPYYKIHDPLVDSIYYGFEGEKINIFIDLGTETIDEDRYYLFKLDAIYEYEPGNIFSSTCLVRDKPSNSSTLLKIEPNSSSARLKIHEQSIDFKFNYNYQYSVLIQRLNIPSYKYYEAVETQLSFTGSLFDAQPASINSGIVNLENPSEIVLGNFNVNGALVRRLKLSSTDIKFSYDQIIRSCETAFPPDYCQDCEAHPDLLSQTPDYWYE